MILPDLTFDVIDRRILAALQDDATLSMNEIAARVGLSATPCWRRIQKLEEAGIITKRVALLHGPSIAAGVSVSTPPHAATANSPARIIGLIIHSRRGVKATVVLEG